MTNHIWRSVNSGLYSWNFHKRPILCAGRPLRSRQRYTVSLTTPRSLSDLGNIGYESLSMP